MDNWARHIERMWHRTTKSEIRKASASDEPRRRAHAAGRIEPDRARMRRGRGRVRGERIGVEEQRWRSAPRSANISRPSRTGFHRSEG